MSKIHKHLYVSISVFFGNGSDDPDPCQNFPDPEHWYDFHKFLIKIDSLCIEFKNFAKESTTKFLGISRN
jgi:hypothetical protein